MPSPSHPCGDGNHDVARSPDRYKRAMQQRFRWLVGAIVVYLVFATGCVASSDYMVESPTLAPPPPNVQAATVVFVRPSAFASGVKMTVMDGTGRFLGDSLPEMYFAAQVPPGEHVFVGWSENTAALRAYLEAGRVYYVEVAPKMGVWSPRVQLLAIKPRAENWEEVAEWLSESTFYVVDEVGGQGSLALEAEEVAERLHRAQEILTEYDEEELEERTLRPHDGTVP